MKSVNVRVVKKSSDGVETRLESFQDVTKDEFVSFCKEHKYKIGDNSKMFSAHAKYLMVVVKKTCVVAYEVEPKTMTHLFDVATV